MWKRSRALLFALGWLCQDAAVAHGQAQDPRLPLRIVTARAPRTFELPKAPAVVWQARVLEPLLSGPVADERGDFVVAHAAGLVSELDARGRARWSVRAGARLVGGPVVLSSGRRLVVTGDAELVLILPSGRIESKTKLPWRDLDALTLVTATSDGGALVASGARFARIGPLGSPTALGTTREPVRALFEWRGLSLFVERGGRVLALGPFSDPFELSSFGSPASAGALRGDRLLAVVADHEVQELELGNGVTRSLWSDASAAPRELRALPNGELYVLLAGAGLLGLDPSGHEVFRVIPPGATSTDTVAGLVADTRGSALVAAAGLELRLIGKSGEVLDVPGTSCPDPLPPIALSTGVVVATCRSGLFFGISDRAR